MVSIVKHNLKIPNPILPIELLTNVLDKADICSKIIKMTRNGVAVFDFKTKKLIRNINSFWYFKLSVSKCGRFVVGSNENFPVKIWNINSGLEVPIDVELSSEYAPLHTFTMNNELLITCNNEIYSFVFCNDTNMWKCNFIYEFENIKFIAFIKANDSTNKFIFSSDTGYVYIMNSTSTNIENILDNFIDKEIININFTNNIIIISTFNENIAFIKTNQLDYKKIVLQKPKPKSRSIIHQFYISNYHILPCFTKVIGGFYNLSFIWDLTTGNIIKKINLYMGEFTSLSPNGTYMVSCQRTSSKINIIDIKDLF